MALSFGDAKGGAEKQSVPSYKMKMGLNRIRVYGGILARYMYWVPGSQGRDVPVECLSFNRSTEAFDNKDKDWVKEYYPDLKSSWGYAMMCVDLDANEPVELVFNWKSKLFKQVVSAMEDLGDPTNLDTGWDIIFSKDKTGPNTFNVEYTLNAIKCSKSIGPVSDKVREVAGSGKTIDEWLPRITPDKQKEYLDSIRAGGTGEGDEVPDELKEQVEENMAALS